MKFKRIISGLLSSCILLNTQVYSFAGDISDRYETFKSDEITVKDILEEDSLDVKIEGNTIVNVLGGVRSAGNHSAISIDNDSNTITFTHNSENTSVTKIWYPDSLAQVNKEYTLMFDIVENTLVNNDYQSVAKFNVVNYNTGVHMVRPGDTGLYKVLLKQPDTTTHDGKPYFEVHNDSIGKLVIKDMMLIEGDYTDKDIPYFEGMKSSFEDNLVTQDMVDAGTEDKKNLGKYKAEIKTTEKNLFDIDSFYEKISSIAGVYKDDNTITFKSSENTSIGTHVARSINKCVYGKFKPNTQYTISHQVDKTGDFNLKMTVVYEDGKKVNVPNNIGQNTYTTDATKTVVRLGIAWDTQINGGMTSWSNIQIEENNKKTDYEEYKENIKIFYLNSPLLKGDTIESINGEFYHVKRSDKKILNGSESWVDRIEEGRVSDDGVNMFFTTKIKQYVVPDGIVASDHEIKETLAIEDAYADGEGFYYYNNSRAATTATTLYYTIAKSKLNTQDIDGFKQWLNQNPITVVYKLAVPEYEPIRSDLKVDLLKGTTHVFNNSYVPSNMEITVDRTANRAIEAVEVAKLSPTVENMSIARMWINLLKESTLKDDFQDTVSDITNISGLELERKKVTANLDMYIKPENSMSMSLSTNSITFDNYTGLEDMEKLGALDITINSSLPYSLNAYMPKELSNSDGSSSMGVNLLNIRDNTESSYSQFINTTDKVVLKSDCDKGNNKVHTIDLKLASDRSFKPDIYKAVIKFEAEQK